MVNVALSADADVVGGKLMALCGGEIRSIEREEGEATVHDSSLLHGVSRVYDGLRYSLIMFYVADTEQTLVSTSSYTV